MKNLQFHKESLSRSERDAIQQVHARRAARKAAIRETMTRAEESCRK